MLKRLLIFSFFITLSTVITYAHIIKGEFTGLATQNIVLLEVNYDDAVIHGMSVEDFAYMERDWDKDKPDIIGKVLANASDATQDVVILASFSNQATYKIKLDVINVTTKGDHLCRLQVINAEGEIEASIENIRGKGGTFGSRLNLIKDGAENTGKEVGNLLKREIRKARKTFK